MDNFNKVISFILGLVVVVVFIAVLTGRINLRRLPFVSKNVTPTVTPTPTERELTPATPTEIPVVPTINTYKSPQTKTPSTIPSTGSPTLLLPLLFSSFAGGIFLRKKK